jgi:hypothetical protein
LGVLHAVFVFSWHFLQHSSAFGEKYGISDSFMRSGCLNCNDLATM